MQVTMSAYTPQQLHSKSNADRVAFGRCLNQAWNLHQHSKTFVSNRPVANKSASRGKICSASQFDFDPWQQPLVFEYLLPAGLVLAWLGALWLLTRVLIWDYTHRRTDNPDDADKQGWSITPTRTPSASTKEATAGNDDVSALVGQRPWPYPEDLTKLTPTQLREVSQLAAQDIMEGIRVASARFRSDAQLMAINNSRVGWREWDAISVRLEREEVLAEQQQRGDAGSFRAPNFVPLQDAKEASLQRSVDLLTSAYARELARRHVARIILGLGARLPAGVESNSSDGGDSILGVKRRQP